MPVAVASCELAPRGGQSQGRAPMRVIAGSVRVEFFALLSFRSRVSAYESTFPLRGCFSAWLWARFSAALAMASAQRLVCTSNRFWLSTRLLEIN